MKKKSFHKTFIALLLVLTPPFFLVFTEEGNRVTDNAVLWLFGQESVLINLKEADSNFTQEQVRTTYPDLDWQCGSVNSPFGKTACNAIIGTFNELPAKHLIVYFVNEQLNAIQVHYREKYHNGLLQHLLETLGQPRNVASATSGTPDEDPVLEWDTGKGLVVLKKSIRDKDQAALLWLANVN